MEKQIFNVVFDGEDFLVYGEDTAGIFEEKADFTAMDKIANGFKWTAHYKAKGQRKYRNSSALTLSIYSMLGLAKFHLNEGHKVYVQTPDIEVHFEKV